MACLLNKIGSKKSETKVSREITTTPSENHHFKEIL